MIRKNPKKLKNYSKIIEAATKIAIRDGLQNIKTHNIAREIGHAHPLIFSYFDSIDEIVNLVIEKAIEFNKLEIVISAIINKRLNIDDLSEELKSKVKDFSVV